MTDRTAQIEKYLDQQELRGMRESERETYRDALSQALAQFDSIAEMVAELREARDDYHGSNADSRRMEEAEEAIHADALSVETRGGWRTPGSTTRDDVAAEEFKILLCTGGPAVQIVGKLSEHYEPENPTLEFQGWFIPWTQVPGWILPDDWQNTLIDYCACFYYGE